MEIESSKTQKKLYEARLKKLTSKAASAKDDDTYKQIEQQILEHKQTEPEAITAPRLMIDDCTIEKLGDLLQKHNERLAIISDEGGFFQTVGGRYNGGQINVDLLNKSFCGSPASVDRMSRETIELDNPLVSMVMVPQPSVVDGLAAHDGFRGTGFLARFTYFRPNVVLGFRTGQGPEIPEHISDIYNSRMQNILNMTPTIKDGKSCIRTIRLSAEAKNIRDIYFTDTERQMRPDGIFSEMTDWAAKAPGMLVKIAGLLHIAANHNQAPEQVSISGETMQEALNIMCVIEQHALVSFNCMQVSPNVAIAKKILAWIIRKNKSEFTFRDCWRANCRGLSEPNVILQPLQILIDCGHIADVDEPANKTGRPKGSKYRFRGVLSTSG